MKVLSYYHLEIFNIKSNVSKQVKIVYLNKDKINLKTTLDNAKNHKKH